MKADNILDKQILLISSDWFQPFISVLLPNLAEDKAMSIKLAAREIVKDFMSGATVYWNISFSNERIADTENKFVRRLRLIGLSDESIDCLIKNQNKEVLDDEVGNTLWLLWSLTEYFANSSENLKLDNFGQNTKKIFLNAYRNVNESDLPATLEDAFKTTDTEWDMYLKDLTPDISSYLCDYAEINITGIQKFHIFWINLQKALDVEVRKVIIQMYLEEAKRIVDSELALKMPAWFI
jgi:hypothetical protein